MKKLPRFIEKRRINGLEFQDSMKNHPDLMIQKEIGNSSWFGFSLVIREESKLSRNELVNRLTSLGFENRPIVTGNFSSSEVMKYFDYEIPFDVKNAEYIDKNGVLVGNHHFSMGDAIEKLSNIKY